MRVKPKKCRQCKKDFMPMNNNGLQHTCSFGCTVLYNESQGKIQPKRKPIKKVSDKRKIQLSDYHKARIGFIQGKFCPVYESGVLGEVKKVSVDDVHHTDGRTGERLLNFDQCIAVSRIGHDWIHNNPKEAREKGWLI